MMTDENTSLSIAIKALQIASGNEAVMKQHLIECRDRFVSLRNITVTGLSIIITTLLSIIGYLFTHYGALPHG